ncbi:MAG TPA: tetratricopeptide repeat protein [Bacteroidetes bacterium]|nr:tetratricopeptide repeat protein [Bacteroidota bacterium]
MLKRLFKLFALSILLVNPAVINAQFSNELPKALAQEVEEHKAKANELENAGDFNQAAFHLNKAATIYWVNGFPSKAITLFEQTITLNEHIGNKNAIRMLNNNIAMIYTDEEDYSKALLFFNKSLSIARQMSRKPDIAASLLNIANVQTEMQKYTDAAKTLEEANAIARELNDAKLLRNCYSLQADVYEKMGNSEKSAEYFAMYTAISQKIQREELRKRDSEARKIVEDAQSKVTEIEQAKQLTEKELLDKQQALKETVENLAQIEQISKERQMQIDLLSKEKELKDAIIKNQKLVRNVFLFIIFVVLAFATLFFYNLRIKKKTNDKLRKQNTEIAKQKELIEQVNQYLKGALNKIEKQNRDITSSINYAQRIQEAMLPPAENLSILKDSSFILFRPRDIVSGDFYWFTGYGTPDSLDDEKHKNFIKLHSLPKNEKGFLISAVDCTGHGIPGAFMSMIGFNLLETIVRNAIVKPHEILRHLHNTIRRLLKQHTTDNRDGMDMAICSIIDNGRKVLFAGAKNPVIYIANGELNYLRGDSLPVGGIQKEDERKFTLHTINVDSPTSFYIFSDGFTDQFGGLHGQKFGTKRFKQLLLEIHTLPMPEQKLVLEQRMDEWIKTYKKQIDDIIVIGFKIDPNKFTV